MALCKNKTSKQGFVTSYHRVDTVSLSNSNLFCRVASYVTKEYRDKNSAAEYFSYNFEVTIEEEESMGIRQLAYKKLKELPEWEDAEDC